jgi:hypothetical protein
MRFRLPFGQILLEAMRRLDEPFPNFYTKPVYFKGSGVKTPRYPVTVIGRGESRGPALAATGENREGRQDNQPPRAAGP